jgi:polyadenylate-binding protein
VQYRQEARNADSASGAASGAASASTPNFAQQLANADPESRKQMLGERLYNLISARDASAAGKITGMLLHGMDESELLHLLEAPGELDSYINEALEELRKAAQHNKGE